MWTICLGLLSLLLKSYSESKNLHMKKVSSIAAVKAMMLSDFTAAVEKLPSFYIFNL